VSDPCNPFYQRPMFHPAAQVLTCHPTGLASRFSRTGNGRPAGAREEWARSPQEYCRAETACV